MKKFDVFIFGTGTAGKLVAKRCAAAGMKTAIIDIQAYGGTCSQRGCDPKKIMLASIEAYELATSMQGDGIAGDIKLDFNAAYKYAKRYTDGIPENTVRDLKNAGITCLHGEASFIDSHTVRLNDEQISASYFVIATGLKTRPLQIPGNEFLLDSASFYELKSVPEKVTFIGAGYIGMEFAHMLARAGSKVTIVERGTRVLAPFEAYTAQFLEQASESLGIKFIFNATAAAVEKEGDRFILKYGMEDGMHQITSDAVFNTSGRVPSIDTMNLEKAGVVTSKHGIVVNEYLQSTTQSHIYACGDVSSKGLPLTPLSSIEASVVAKNLTGKKTILNIPDIPSAVFTLPNVAGIGLTEQEAHEQKLDVTVTQEDATTWFNNRRIHGSHYAYKIITETKSGLILGAHIISHEASEQINMFAIAMKAKMTFKAFKKTIFTYPSWGNDIKSY